MAVKNVKENFQGKVENIFCFLSRSLNLTLEVVKGLFLENAFERSFKCVGNLNINEES